MAFLPKAGEKKCAMLKRHSAHVIDADEACHCQSKKMIGNSWFKATFSSLKHFSCTESETIQVNVAAETDHHRHFAAFFAQLQSKSCKKRFIYAFFCYGIWPNSR